MDEIKIPLNDFDLTGFIGRDVSFIRDLGNGNPAPISAIPVVEENGLTPDLYKHAAERTPHDELVKENKTLYFPFSSLNNGETLPCADGRRYNIPKPENKEKHTSDLTMDERETVGYLVKTSDGQVSIQFAKQFIGNNESPASVQTLEHVGPLEDGMKAFLETFISG